MKQIDKLEMIMQAFRYEKAGYDKPKLKSFWDSVEGTLTEPNLKAIFKLLKEERNKQR